MMIMMMMMTVITMMVIAMKSYYIIWYMDCRLGHWVMKSSQLALSIPDLVVVSCCL